VPPNGWEGGGGGRAGAQEGTVRGGGGGAGAELYGGGAGVQLYQPCAGGAPKGQSGDAVNGLGMPNGCIAPGTQLPGIPKAPGFGGSNGDPEGTAPSIGGPPSGVTYLYRVVPNILFAGGNSMGIGACPNDMGGGKGNMLTDETEKLDLANCMRCA